ncbi:hypothetical protein Scep_017300 [Stephania cephalantha]|uniref:Uncharacterized protein n=1 Tax=Stephania cephalantha TaxID=152367 RepID=A0AAP0IR51_9MAGN
MPLSRSIELNFNSELFDLSMVASLLLISLMVPLVSTPHLYANKVGPIHYPRVSIQAG